MSPWNERARPLGLVLLAALQLAILGLAAVGYRQLSAWRSLTHAPLEAPPLAPAAAWGTIEGVGDDRIEVLTPTSLHTVLLDADTRIVDDRAPATRAALRPGVRVLVWGEQAIQGIHARLIQVSAAP